MPAVSAKQQKFMGMCAHGGGGENCPPQDVAEEFSHKPEGGYRKSIKEILDSRHRKKRKRK